jgi:hypothetical protein
MAERIGNLFFTDGNKKTVMSMKSALKKRA